MRPRARWLLAGLGPALLLGVLLFLLLSTGGNQAVAQAPLTPVPDLAHAPEAALTPDVRFAEHQDTSLTLLEMIKSTSVGGLSGGNDVDGAPAVSPQTLDRQLNRLELPKARAAGASPAQAGAAEINPAIPWAPVVNAMPEPQYNFEGIYNVNSVLPPDTNGDTGLTHYVQWVNLSMSIWRLDRSQGQAVLVYGPRSGNTLWRGFGGACENTNDGDPIVLYDHLAGRWLVSQFSIPNDTSGPYYQCIAVSTGEDPTGAWHRYSFRISDAKMNDYPHFGVWPDAYYATINQFVRTNWAGAGVLAFEREKMLAGLPARMVYFDLYGVSPAFGGMLPADLDGPPPPSGSGHFFAEVDDTVWLGPQDALRVWEFKVDWTLPTSSTFGLNGQPNFTLPVEPFNPLCASSPRCVPQPETNVRLDTVADRLMHRLQYRNYGEYETLLANHSVDAGAGRAAVRWYEMRRMEGEWTLYQQGTYAGSSPNDSAHRWMGSAALDRTGNMALGYSLSGAQVYPSIAYTGRLASDPLGLTPQGETLLMPGGGSQLHPSGRWGDYSMLGIDPVDDCTFWYTSQYYTTNSLVGWRTRIGSFAFPSCLAQSRGYLEGRIQSTDGTPIEGAQVQAGAFTTLTGADGFYRFFALPSGIYTVSVSHYEFLPGMATNVVVEVTPLARRDFQLQRAPVTLFYITVQDGSGQGWPLYARLGISAPGYARTIYTHPLTGQLQLSLTQGVEHTLELRSDGYTTHRQVFVPQAPEVHQIIPMTVSTDPCAAPGYARLAGCSPIPGGLILGHVLDTNTGLPINQAELAFTHPLTSTQVLTGAAMTRPTPDDPALPDGFYVLFAASPQPPEPEPDPTLQTLEAHALGYAPQSQTVQVGVGDVISTSFHLPAGRLELYPQAVQAQLVNDASLTYTLFITNTGTLSTTFRLIEVNAPVEADNMHRGFAAPQRRSSPKRLADLDARAVYTYAAPQAPVWPGGELLVSWPTGLVNPWGISLDPETDLVWISSAAAAGGDDVLHAYIPDGRPANRSIPFVQPEVVFAADLAYNPYTRSFWQVLVGGAPCLAELDSSSLVSTGHRLCPNFDHSQRGLAFNPRQGVFYSAAWSSGLLFTFDTQGRLLSSANLGLNFSGLAYNPLTRHLFALTNNASTSNAGVSNASEGYDVYVLDEANGFAVLGGFDVPSLDAWQQAGLDLDCQGRLWTVNQATGQALAFASGEQAACGVDDILWLEVAPVEGLLQPGESQSITLHLRSEAAVPGLNEAHLLLTSPTPYGDQQLPVALTYTGRFYMYLPNLLAH